MAEKGTICVIFSDFKNDFNDGYVLGIQKQANALGYRTVTFSMPQLSELYTNAEEAVFELIDFDRYDGVIFSERSFAAHRNLILPIETAIRNKCHVPVVVIGESDITPNVVQLDMADKFAQIAKHLIDEHGCKTIYCLGGDKNTPDSRIDSFQTVMQAHNLACDDRTMLYGGYWIQGAELLAKELAFHERPLPDAVMCLNDEIAYVLIKNLFRFGIRVPDDVLVTGFAGSHLADNGALSITTFPADTQECGCTAMAMLHGLLTGTYPQTLPTKKLSLITGESCGCGKKPSEHVSALLDTFQKTETAEMEFRNARIEEKLYKIQSMTDFSLFVKNHKYLIRDQISVGVNCMGRDAKDAVCVYLKDYLINGENVPFRAQNIYPDIFSFGAIQNVHVLPLVFDAQIYGFMTIGYAEEKVFTILAKQFAKYLAIGLEILSVRQAAPSLSVQPMLPDTTPVELSTADNLKSSAYILVVKNNGMHKIPIDNVLYFESSNKHVYAFTKTAKMEVKQRLVEIEPEVSERNFFRISKSILANMSKIIGYEQELDRTLSATLINKEVIRVSRKYATAFIEMWSQNAD